MHNLIKIILMCYLFIQMNIFAREELHIVQSVSQTKRSFVLNKGIADGIVVGQEVMISNENVSMICRAIEVTRNFSLWEPLDLDARVPFKRDDFISYNPHFFGSIAIKTSDLQPTNQIQSSFDKFNETHSWSLFYNYALGVYQSSSDVSTSNNSKRNGVQFGFDYNLRFAPELEIASGLRFDNEVYRLDEGNLDVESSRQMLYGSFTYHFLDLFNSAANPYLGISAGIGKSKTTINEESSSGIAYLAPEVKFGYFVPFTKSKAFRIEASIEHISSTEEFSEDKSQNNTIINSKLSIGIRF